MELLYLATRPQFCKLGRALTAMAFAVLKVSEKYARIFRAYLRFGELCSIGCALRIYDSPTAVCCPSALSKRIHLDIRRAVPNKTGYNACIGRHRYLGRLSTAGYVDVFMPNVSLTGALELLLSLHEHAVCVGFFFFCCTF